MVKIKGKEEILYVGQTPDTTFNSYKAGMEKFYLTVGMFKYDVTIEQFVYLLKRLDLKWGRFM